MSKVKYPNPGFFRAKTNMDWKAQAANVREIGAIVGEMIKETDWKAVWQKTKENGRQSALSRIRHFGLLRNIIRIFI